MAHGFGGLRPGSLTPKQEPQGSTARRRTAAHLRMTRKQRAREERERKEAGARHKVHGQVATAQPSILRSVLY